MPRQPRFLPPDNYYHIINRGNSGNVIFTCKDDYQYYLDKLAELKIEHPFDLAHYCLVPTHTHMLIKVLEKTDFSTFSKRLNLSYASYYKRNYGLVGHLWQGRFKSQLISSDSYLIQCGKYIELNPVRAAIVKNPKDYQFSSYNHYAFGKDDNLVSGDVFYEELGSNNRVRRKKYRDLIISDLVDEDMSGKKIAIGSGKFVYNAKKKNIYHIEHRNTAYRRSQG